jgi:hypothetical protein
MFNVGAYNPGYSGGRDQEDSGSRNPISKKTLHKKGLMEWAQGVGPEFKLQHCKTEKKKRKRRRKRIFMY